MSNLTWDVLNCMGRDNLFGSFLNKLPLNIYTSFQEIYPPTLAVTLLLLWLIYYYLYLPMNWTKDLSDVGYDHLLPSREGKSKKELVSRLRRARKLGNVPPIYPNGWFMIAESSEIPVGQVKHISALGENFAVFRTASGKCNVLDAYCPHLGANMGIGGKVKGDCLECPFHQWRFSGTDGKCTMVPYSEKIPKFAQVKHWLSCEVNDFIFIWYHAEGEEPQWYPNEIPQITNKKYVYRGRNQFLVNCHIQEVPENGGDLAHFVAVHSDSMLSGSDLRYSGQSWFNFFKHNWHANWEPCTIPTKQHIGLSTLSHYITLFGKYKVVTCSLNIAQVGPGYVELVFDTSFGPMVLLQTVTPIEPLLQKIVHRIYCPPILSLYATFIMLAECIMIQRDIMLWNHKMFKDKPLLVKEERTIVKYRRWFSQFYSEHSPLFSFKESNIEW